MATTQTFQDHIHEVRRRLLIVGLTIGLSAGLAYNFRNQAIEAIQKPLGAPLFYSSPGGGFDFVLKLSVVIGMFITLPVLVFQLVRFIEPALPRRLTVWSILKVMAASTFLAALGMAFAYFMMIPQSLHFFNSFTTTDVKPLISADSYLSYVINNLITFALAFQIPLFILFINWIRPIKPGKLLRYQRHVIVGAFGLAVILPFTYEPIQQFMIAIPIIGLFYLSVVLLAITNRSWRRDKTAQVVAVTAHVAPVAQPAPALETPHHQPQPLMPSLRPRLSMDGMRGAQPAMAARVAPAPTIQQTISRPSVKVAATPVRKPASRGFSIDGFYVPQTPSAG